MPSFKVGDIVHRYFKTSGRISADTYTVVKIDKSGVWIVRGTLDGSAGRKAYSPDSLLPSTKE